MKIVSVLAVRRGSQMETMTNINYPSKTLPGGTVTFLFTDIEGSTRLLNKLGDQYALILATQRQLLRSAFEHWQGQEVDTQGDAFFVAFTRASDAISAGVQIQTSLAQQSWPQEVEINVRIGLHTGEVNLTSEGYVGMDVNRAARICSAGHGGQILLSSSTATLIMNNLPQGISLRDLGEHRLKDLSHPEHLYQLTFPGGINDFPALKSLNTLPNNLPMQLTNFFGRQNEIEQLKKLLNETRLITITGPGGSGKSRLSLQAAADLVDQFADGVWFVPMVNLASSDEIPGAIANALHFRVENFSSNVNIITQLSDYLSKRSMLLVLDNFEHLLDGSGLLKDILAKAPHIKLLLTSRECLNIPEEWIFAISGLSYPQNGHKDVNGIYSALILFQERARHVNPDFDLTPDDRPYASTICRLVGGLPLAIELAAPWTSILSCQEIAQEIEHNLDFLADTLRGLPEGHRSLRAVFEHSWSLLDAAERSAFCNLSVFQGGFDRTAARQVAEVGLPMLMNLVNKSLVQHGVGDRFQMHALLQQYAIEHLQAMPPGKTIIREKHSRYYLNILKRWQTSKPGDAWLPNLEKMLLENGNFRVMICWALIQWEEAEARLALDSLGPIYLAQGFYDASNSYQFIITFLCDHGASLGSDTPMRSLLLNALSTKLIYDAALGDPNVEVVAKECVKILRNLDLDYELGACLYALGVVAINHSNYPEVVRLLEEARPLIKGTDHAETIAGNCIWLGWAYHELGEYDKARHLYEQAYQVSKEQGVGVLIPYALDKLGFWADSIGDFQQGMQYHQEALKMHKILGAQSGQAYALSRMSVSALELGEFVLARQYAQEGYECFKAIGHRWGMTISKSRIGFAELAQERYAEAQKHFLQGLKLAQEFGMPAPSIYAMIGLAILESRQGNAEEAVEMLTVAIDHPNTPFPYKDIAKKELELLRGKLADDRFSQAEAQGLTQEIQKVIDKLLEGSRV